MTLMILQFEPSTRPHAWRVESSRLTFKRYCREIAKSRTDQLSLREWFAIHSAGVTACEDAVHHIRRLHHRNERELLKLSDIPTLDVIELGRMERLVTGKCHDPFMEQLLRTPSPANFPLPAVEQQVILPLEESPQGQEVAHVDDTPREGEAHLYLDLHNPRQLPLYENARWGAGNLLPLPPKAHLLIPPPVPARRPREEHIYDDVMVLPF